jgi:hypothetical protein
VGTEQTAAIDAETIHRTCQRALWEPAPTGEALPALIGTIEGYVRQLSPEVAAIVPRMQTSTRDAALCTLRHVDELLAPDAPSANLPERLHDLGVTARALLVLHTQCREPLEGEVAIGHGGWTLMRAPVLLET